MSGKANRQDYIYDKRIESLMVTATSSTWAERLVLNLFSYSPVLIPIALIVIATKFKLFPRSIQSSALIQRFVYGTTEFRESTKQSKATVGENGDDGSELLLDRKVERSGRQNIKRPDSDKDNRSGVILKFLSCLIGLQVSYLIWGVLQEKIMTTNYPITTKLSSGQLSKLNDLNGISDQSHHMTNSSKRHETILTVTFHDSQFLVFINRLVAFIMAILALVFTRHREFKLYSNRYRNIGITESLMKASTQRSNKPPAPLYEYVYSSLSNILSSWCQYEALKYINFPTQCLSKSCKVIPVMLMSKLLLNKRHSYIDYFCALLLALGMFVFMLNQPIDKYSHAKLDVKGAHVPGARADNGSGTLDDGSSRSDDLSATSKRNRSLILSGLVILSLYLTFDSFTSNWQQSLYSRYDISSWQMMAAINFYSIFLTLTSLYQLGNLRPAFNLLASSPNLLRDCLLMSVMSSIGQMFVYYTIKQFGSVIFAVIMTLRQFLSILLSCIIYKHQLNFSSSIGLILVFLVVAFQTWHKYKRSASPIKQKAPATEVSQMETLRQNSHTLIIGDDNNKRQMGTLNTAFK